MTKKAFEKIKEGLEDAKAYMDGTADLSKYNIYTPEEMTANLSEEKQKYVEDRAKELIALEEHFIGIRSKAVALSKKTKDKIQFRAESKSNPPVTAWHLGYGNISLEVGGEAAYFTLEGATDLANWILAIDDETIPDSLAAEFAVMKEKTNDSR